MDSTKSLVSNQQHGASQANVSVTAKAQANRLLALTPRGLEILKVLADVFDSTGCTIPRCSPSDSVPAESERPILTFESTTENEA